MKDIILSISFLWMLFISGDALTTTTTKPILYNYGRQTFGFDGSIKSGPIVFINKKVIFIPNLHYDQRDQDTYFWISNSEKPSNQNGQLIPDENGSQKNLRSYQGENIYLTLPGNVTTDSIQYFGVWSPSEQTDLGHIELSESFKSNIPEKVGFEQKTEDGKSIIRLPKCCQFNAILSTDGCVENADIAFTPNFNIYEHNQTHMNNESLNVDDFYFEPYTNSMICPAGKYALDKNTETFGILMNGSVIVRSYVILGILSQGEFCIDNVQTENGTDMKILVCAPEVVINHAMFSVYITLLIISVLCFAGAFILYCFVLDCKTVPKKCFMGYAFSMCVTFFCLIIIQIAYVEDVGCKVLGFLFEITMISSFTWLAVLCFDILYVIRRNDDPRDHRKDFRLMWYLGIVIGVPLLFIIISLFRNLTPDVPDSFFKPQYGRNTCYFEESDQRKIIFYLPIGISVVVSCFCLAFAKYKIIQSDKTLTEDYFWSENVQNFKFTHRQCFFTWVIMTGCWIIEVISSFLDDTSGIYNAMVIIEALQGFFIVMVFTMDHYGKKLLKKKNQNNVENVEITPLN